MKLSKEIKTGILAVLAILLFIWGYNFLKGNDLFSSNKTIYVEYDNVEGLTRSTAVTINGLIVGNVSDIQINPENGKVLVSLLLKTDFPISKSSVASIYEPGFIAGKQIAIKPNFADKSAVASGERIAGAVEAGLTTALQEKLTPIQQKLEKVLDNVDKLISGINNTLDSKAQQNIKNILSELDKTSTEFSKIAKNTNGIVEENKDQIKGMVKNFNTVSGNFVKISDSLQKANLGETVRTLNKTLANVNTLTANLQAGKGTMGKLMTDDAFYKNLEKTTKELELLLQDLRLNPTRYVNVSVFGKKNKPYVAPAESEKKP